MSDIVTCVNVCVSSIHCLGLYWQISVIYAWL